MSHYFRVVCDSRKQVAGFEKWDLTLVLEVTNYSPPDKHLKEHQSAERKVAGSNSGRTTNQGFTTHPSAVSFVVLVTAVALPQEEIAR